MAITNETTIETLIALGVINPAVVGEWNTKANKLEAKAAKAALVNGTAAAITALLDSEVQASTKYFSVKKTGNSVGLLAFVETDRSTVLKALTLLVSQDKIKKIGLVAGVEKLPSEVNAFQIRYTRA